MGVYIKGMEMPKNCAECPCRMIGYTKDHCNVLGKFIDFVVGSEGRREDCPLIEIPPHGRLIDADALMKEFEKAENTMAEHGQEYSCSFMSSSQEISTEWYVVEEMVDNSPTIIPADKDGET